MADKWRFRPPPVEEGERVILTEDNIKVVAKRSGKEERLLREAFYAAHERGGTASVRIREGR